MLKTTENYTQQEIVFKKDKATLHVISKRCEDSKLFRRRSADVTLVYEVDE